MPQRKRNQVMSYIVSVEGCKLQQKFHHTPCDTSKQDDMNVMTASKLARFREASIFKLLKPSANTRD